MSDTQTPVLKTEQRTRCEVWTRVMGYHRPVTSFNPGKQSEYADRQFFTETSLNAADTTHVTNTQR